MSPKNKLKILDITKLFKNRLIEVITNRIFLWKYRKKNGALSGLTDKFKVNVNFSNPKSTF